MSNNDLKTSLTYLMPVCCALLAGCAVIRTSEPDGMVVGVHPEPRILQTAQDTTTAVVSSPTHRIQQLLHSAFTAVGEGEKSQAADSLDVAANYLTATYDQQGSISASIDRITADDLSLAAIDIYFDARSGTDPIDPEEPLAQLIQSLPTDLHETLKPNKRYRNLYIRTLAGTSPVHIDLKTEVENKIAFFQKNDQRIFRTWMRRMGTYGPLIRRTLREEGIPEDLIYLSMIESGFNTKAYSHARAVGMWQFVKHTGRLYGLKTDTWVDERRDPEKATRAAARHIGHLYNLFGDWQLVITGYNCGQGRLQRAMRADGSHDFWKLHSLPKETRNHLPKFMAVLLMARDPEFFGVHNLVEDDAFSYDIVQVGEAVDLRLAAQCVGEHYEAMRVLNSELRLSYSPPITARKTYALRVPIGTSDRFIDQYARIPADKKVQLVDYRVRPGDTVSDIAQAFGVRAGVVMDANAIRNPRRLRSGQKLKIPIHPKQSRRAMALAQQKGSAVKAGEGDRVAYRVKRGDNLWSIARSQGVTERQLRAWNTLKATGHIHPGDKLTIWKHSPTGSASLASSHAIHRVRSGDTLWDIARTYNTSVRELKRLNSIRNASQIRAGDRIRIRSSAPAVE